MRSLSGAVCLLALCLSNPAARASNFDFSFTGSPVGSTVPGTVTGEILGLAAFGASTPADVLLFSDPDGVATGDLTAAGWFTPSGEPDSFTVVNGAIVADNFTLFDPTTNRQLILGSENLLIDFINGDQTGNVVGLGGVTFTPAAVDEPGSAALVAVGLLGLVMIRGRKALLF